MSDEEDVLVEEDRENWKALNRELHYAKKDAAKVVVERDALRAKVVELTDEHIVELTAENAKLRAELAEIEARRESDKKMWEEYDAADNAANKAIEERQVEPRMALP